MGLTVRSGGVGPDEEGDAEEGESEGEKVGGGGGAWAEPIGDDVDGGVDVLGADSAAVTAA